MLAMCCCIATAAPRLRRAPAKLIASNAGVEGEVIVEALTGQPFEMGYNAMDDRIEVRSRRVSSLTSQPGSSSPSRLFIARRSPAAG